MTDTRTSVRVTAAVAPEPSRYLQLVTQRVRHGVKERRSAAQRHRAWLGLFPIPTAYRERHTRSLPYLKWIRRLWAERADKLWRFRASLSDSEAAIRFVFGRYAEQALAVSWCEGRHNTRAYNGQYLDMFQMGSSERTIYGHGSTPLEQARAAYRYFVASGRDWSPWSCKP